jgi:glycerol-3-phosphate dehydrogenase (NAD(P)+)
MKNKIKTISVIGDGGWGTTLAVHLAKRKFSVILWGAFDEYVQKVKRNRENEKFLPGIKIPLSVDLTSDLSAALHKSDLVVFAVPSKYAACVLADIKKKRIDWRGKVFLSVTKGIDTEYLLRVSQLTEKFLGKIPFAVLSGPTIAMEVAKGIPSSAVIACKNQKVAQNLQAIFNSETFRIYTNNDVAGVEIGGSVKNIIAIACGICDGLGYGTNTKAALLTRSLAEMARLGKVCGAKAETFFGLSGLGDLVTTCFNEKSRNRTVGEQLGQGKKIKSILSSTEMVAEGVETVKATFQLSQKRKIPMPVTEEVYRIIYQHKNPRQAVSDLMRRKVKAE